jgi:tRNA pseudouridine55 synthase
VDGVLVVDKPAGPTSHDVVDRARRALGTRRIGHTGTLDPFATGVLVLCVGRATRLARFLAAGEKAYRARVRLGFATSTDDSTGEPLAPARRVEVTAAELARALAGLVGSFDQVPPAFSARQVGGRRMYELARRGDAVVRAATPVTVHALELVSREGDTIELDVRCSAGTYVRALARDLGERLGTCGHLSALRRTRSGGFDLSQAVPADRLEEEKARLIPLSRLLPELPAVTVGAEGRQRIAHGRELAPEHVVAAFPSAGVGRVRIVGEDGELLGLAVARGPSDGSSALPARASLHPDLVLVAS